MRIAYLYLLLIILLVFILTKGISSLYDYDEPYEYRCHKCKKRFRERDLEDLKGWHVKDWTCPKCKHKNVTTR